MKKKIEKAASMIDPPMNSLLKRVDSKFTLVVAVAKRARQLVSGAQKLIDNDIDKPVTLAIKEIDEGKITYIRTKSGLK